MAGVTWFSHTDPATGRPYWYNMLQVPLLHPTFRWLCRSNASSYVTWNDPFAAAAAPPPGVAAIARLELTDNGTKVPGNRMWLSQPQM